jgi:polar amino acid transport system substrate-binding protein
MMRKKVGENRFFAYRSRYQNLWLTLILLLTTSSIQARPAPTVINIQSTVTPPIWSPTLAHGGMGGAILKLLSDEANIAYQLSYLPVKRFQQSTATFRVGDPDILATQKPYAVLPLMTFRSALFFYLPHHKPIKIHHLRDMAGHTLGVLRGTVEDKSYFINHGIKVEENDSIESLLRKLKKGRVDFCILVRISGLHSIKQLFPTEQKNFHAVQIANSERPVALIIDQDTAIGKTMTQRYQQVLHKTLYSVKYREILETYYGKNNVPIDWFTRLDKFERIYAPETN